MVRDSLDHDVQLAEWAAHVVVGVWVVDNLVAELVYDSAGLASFEAVVLFVEDELGAAGGACPLVGMSAFVEYLHGARPFLRLVLVGLVLRVAR